MEGRANILRCFDNNVEIYKEFMAFNSQLTKFLYFCLPCHVILLVLAVYALFKRICKSNKPFHHLSRYLVCVSIAIQTLAIVSIAYFLLQVTHDCGEFTRVTSGLVLFLVFNMGWLYAYEALSVVTHMHRVSTQHLLTPEKEVRLRTIFVGSICAVCIVVCLGFFISSLYANVENSNTFK